jgi:hypothetical protein
MKPGDIPAKGLAVTIAKLEVEQVGQDRERKGILYFRGEDKGLVLNKTNSTMIASFCGNNTDDWRDKVIILVREPTRYAGKPTEGIRVRQPKPTTTQAKPAPVKRVESEDLNVPFDGGDPGSQAEDATEDYDYRD